MPKGPLGNVVEFLQSNHRRMFEGLIWYHSTGHMILENDRVARIALADNEFRERPPLLLHQANEKCDFVAKVFAHSQVPVQILQTPNAVEIQSEVARFFPELTINAGHWSFRALPRRPDNEDGFRFLWTQDFEADRDATYRQYCLLVRRTQSLNIWRKYVDEVLVELPENKEFVDFLCAEPFFALQVRYNDQRSFLIRTGTGSSQVVAPSELIPLLEYLGDLGMRIVQVGRESLPAELSKFNIYHYPSSKFCSFSNDFVLARMAASALTFASGINFIYDLMSKSYVSVHAWDLVPYCLGAGSSFPSMLVDVESGKMLNFIEHNLASSKIARMTGGAFKGQSLFKSVKIPPEAYRDIFREVFEPNGDHLMRSDEIQSKAQKIDPRGLWGLTNHRIPVCIRNYYPEFI
jgi:hypothetical protein